MAGPYANTALLGASQAMGGADPLMSSLLGLAGSTGAPSVAQSLGGGVLDQLAQADPRMQQPVQQLHAFAEQSRLQQHVAAKKEKTPRVEEATSDIEQQQLAFIQDPNRSPEEIQQAMGALRQRNMLTPGLEEAFQARLGSEQPVKEAPVASQQNQDIQSMERELISFLGRSDVTNDEIQSAREFAERRGLSSSQLSTAFSRALQTMNTRNIRGGRQ